MEITLEERKQRVHAFAVSLCSAARVFTLEQVARHPDLSYRTQPTKRASEFLTRWRSEFEVLPALYGKPFVWRFSAKGRKMYKPKDRSINPASKKIEHWLALGDLWQAMTMQSGRPSVYMTEPKDSCDFDVYTVWNGKPFLIEVQRSRLSEKKWREKWEKREAWYKERGFEKAGWQTGKVLIVPRPILICEGIQVPEHVPGMMKTYKGIKNFVQKISLPDF